MGAYYNEIDRYAAQWLRNLIAAGHIAPGDVDERSIKEVQPDDLRGYSQCHFFAGIGGWSYALRLAGWPDDRPVWTGSCPCQPFSAAGRQRGSEDERHLWPSFFDLIRERRPTAVFGEQVAGAAGLAWLDHVCADLEGAGYAAAAADMCAAGVGAPHIRQRLYWVAHESRNGWRQGCENDARRIARSGAPWRRRSDGGAGVGLADATEQRSQGRDEPGQRADAQRAAVERGGANDPWSRLEWIACSEGKARPTEPGLQPLANGLPKGMVRGGDSGAPIDVDAWAEARVMRLRGYGNAIVPQVAAVFVEACDAANT